MFRYVCLGILLLTMSTMVHSANIAEEILFDQTTRQLSQSIKEASHKQAVYSYNIANMMTPGFEPVLFEEDYERLADVLPGNAPNSEIMMEHFVARLTENRSKHSGYVKLMNMKLGMMRQAASGGKK